ncbi:hybrid sensor histidine kinase/response regulator [Flavobacterium psychrotrophum]|uniref:hybrid sensor histidine kinase/response regulator n=1 Tax=Flavobacterium psychrotrophum TaxID=2294119 RepID=UPI000E31B0F1|nr:hybrid sensor histidine kinase/response regulator [Flavobacterium psychrotrophum]
MAQTHKAVKYKVITGYLLIICAAVLSAWFVYTEIIKASRPNKLAEDNAKIIRVSNTIAALYSSEALGRTAILTLDKKKLRQYNKLTDSIAAQLDTIKSETEPSQRKKFDSIQLLLKRKKNSIAEISAFHKAYNKKDFFTDAVTSVNGTREEVWQKTKPVKITKKYDWNEDVKSILTPKQMDSLSKLPVSNDSLTQAFKSALKGVSYKNKRLAIELYHKEQKLLQENQIISDKLRTILTSIENDFIQKSYNEVAKTQNTLNNTVSKVAWVGAITLICLIILATIIIRDLGINQNYRRRLEVLNKENEQLLRTRSMLMATVTHDLQTPLGSIFGFHDLLKESGVSENQKHYLANIRESADYIMKLVNDLLDFSRLENNRITIEQIPFNVKHTIETACSALQPMAENKGIELNWDVEEVLDRNYISDPYRIKQVLTNLISNAIKFTGEGSVEVTAKIDGFDISISVLDTGIGIAPDKHENVFKEFTQAHSGIEKRFGGTGLGLTISKGIMGMLGGTIILESQEGQGSIFTITIPCIAARELAEDVTQPKVAASIKGKKILVVDDDTTHALLMKELLRNNGAVVTIEAHAPNVISLLELADFDVLLTDIQMPVMNGFTLVQNIRSHKNNRIAEMTVIALSGRRDLDDSYYIEKGFTAHQPKPVNMAALSAIIANRKDDFLTDMASEEIDSRLYDLQSLSQFTQNDPESLRIIIETFTESAVENCEELLQAARDNDDDRLARIAHKMIPMLRQMEVCSIAELLLPLEEGTLNLTSTVLLDYCKKICEKMSELCNLLQKEIA